MRHGPPRERPGSLGRNAAREAERRLRYAPRVDARDGSSDAVVGILANPMAGRDVRRLAARASTTTLEIKRDQVTRAAVGAVAAGARRLLVVREPFRIATGALEHLSLDAEVQVLDVGAELKARDTARAVQAMRTAGCGALVVLGGDGTHRAVAKAWSDAPLVALSTGTNNVFPASIEATSAGAAAGLLASGRVALPDVATRAKCVRVEVEGEESDLALIDAVLLVDDAVGNYMPFDTGRIRRVVLSRAEPTAVGTSPIGGLTLPCREGEDAGVEVTCVGADDGGRPLLVPISPGLYRPVRVAGVRRLSLGEQVVVKGPGVLAFDGDRERCLASGQEARLRVVREGPFVVDVDRALTRAAREGVFLDRSHWHDALDAKRADLDCC
jgi:predicted polyphosphate/ATP-dependent NAD kinase